MKKFSYNGHIMTIERKGLGQYTLTGENSQGVVGSYIGFATEEECDGLGVQ